MKLDKHTMTVGDVARALGLSVARIQQLDADLAPTRTVSNQRRYDPAQVEAYAKRRAR